MLSYSSLLFVFMMFEMFQVYSTMTTIKVNSENVTYTDEYIESKYDYQTSEVRHGCDGTIKRGYYSLTWSLELEPSRHYEIY
jgi:hypothetical protein